MVSTVRGKNRGQRKHKTQPKIAKKNHEHRKGLPPIAAFLFESAYQLITWVCIGGCLAAGFYFLSKDNMRGAFWSGIFLGACILFMLGMLGDRHFFQGGGHFSNEGKTNTKNDPVIGVDIGGTLDPTAPTETRFVVTNRSSFSIREVWSEVEMWDARYFGPLFAQPNLARISEIKPQAQITIDGRFLAVGVLHLKNPEALLTQITIHYTYGPSNTEGTRYVRFTTERRADGSYVWFPAGEGKGGVRPEELPTAERPKDTNKDRASSSDSSHANGRARIAVTQMVGIPLPGTQVSGLQVWFTNFGKTTAFRCRFSGQIQFVPRGQRPQEVPFNWREDQSVAMVEPNQKMTASFGRLSNYTFTEEDFESFKAGERVVYMIGKFLYDDAAGRDHWTTFSNRLRQDMVWETAPSGNDAGDN